MWHGALIMITYGVWVSRLLLSAVFGLSAWGKLTEHGAARRAVGEFGVPVRWVTAVALGLPVVEGMLAVAVLLPWSAPWAGCVALVLLAVFTIVVARLLARKHRPACSCFGAASTTPVSGATITRNAVLGVVAALVVGGGVTGDRVPEALPTDHAVGLAVITGLGAVLVWQGSGLRALRRRVDEQAAVTLGPEGLPAGSVAPEFDLPDTSGGRVTLGGLLAAGRRVLLVFVHPGCELCAMLADELPRWRERTANTLTIVVVGNGDMEANAGWAREHHAKDLLVQESNEAAVRYRVRGTPSAVLVDTSGRIDAPVARGATAIRELLAIAKKPARP
jgi:methylamine dehydrogenase accessory protein MauD